MKRKLSLSAFLFESIRQSVESLPCDGDEMTLDANQFEELKLCADSFGAAEFAKRYTRHAPVTIQKSAG